MKICLRHVYPNETPREKKDGAWSLDKCMKHHPTKMLLYGHLSPISKKKKTLDSTKRSKNEFLSKFLQWTPTYGHTSVGPRTNTFFHRPWMSCR